MSRWFGYTNAVYYLSVEITEFVKESRIPLKTLRLLLKTGLIQDPLTDEDLAGLRFLDKTWANRDLMRAQLASFSIVRRKRLLETTDLETKWERYAYARLMNLKPDQQFRMTVLFYEIQETYKFTLDKYHKRRLYQIRDKVYHQRRKMKAALKSSVNTGNQINDTL